MGSYELVCACCSCLQAPQIFLWKRFWEAWSSLFYMGDKPLCPSFCVPGDEVGIPAPALILRWEAWGWEHDLLSPPALPHGRLAVARRAEPLQTLLRKGREMWLCGKLGCVTGSVSRAAATSEKMWVGKSDTFLKVTFWKNGPKYLTSYFFLGKTYQWMRYIVSMKWTFM